MLLFVIDAGITGKKQYLFRTSTRHVDPNNVSVLSSLITTYAREDVHLLHRASVVISFIPNEGVKLVKSRYQHLDSANFIVPFPNSMYASFLKPLTDEMIEALFWIDADSVYGFMDHLDKNYDTIAATL